MRAEQAKQDNGRFEIGNPKKPSIEIKMRIAVDAELIARLKELRDIVHGNDKK